MLLEPPEYGQNPSPMSTPTAAPSGEDGHVTTQPLIIGLSVGGAVLLIVVLILVVVLVIRRRKSSSAADQHKEEGGVISPSVLSPSLDGWSRDKDKAAATPALAGSAKAYENLKSLHNEFHADLRPSAERSRSGEHDQPGPDDDLYAAVGKDHSCHYGVVDEQAVEHYHAKTHTETGAATPCAPPHEEQRHHLPHHHQDAVQDDITRVAGAQPEGSDDKSIHNYPEMKHKHERHRPSPLTIPQPNNSKAQCRHTFSGTLSPDVEKKKRDRTAWSECPAQLLSPPASASEGNFYFILEKEPGDETESPTGLSHGEAQVITRQGSEVREGYEEFCYPPAAESPPAVVTSPESRDYYSISDLAADLKKRTASYENTDFGSQSHVSKERHVVQSVTQRLDSDCSEADPVSSPQSPLYYNALNLHKLSHSHGNSTIHEASDGSNSTDSGISASLPDIPDHVSCDQSDSCQSSMTDSPSCSSLGSMYVNSQTLTSSAGRREQCRATHVPQTRETSSAGPRATKRGPHYQTESADSSRTRKRPRTLPSPVRTNVQEPLYCLAKPVGGEAAMTSPEVSPYPEEDVFGDFYFRGQSDVPCMAQNQARRGADDIYNHLHQVDSVERRDVYSHTEIKQHANHTAVQDDMYTNIQSSPGLR